MLSQLNDENVKANKEQNAELKMRVTKFDFSKFDFIIS